MSSLYLPSHVIEEVNFSSPIKRDDSGIPVKRIQEWLAYHRFSTGIDSDFGPATEQCVLGFQKAQKIPATGIVDQETFSRLVEPLRSVLTQISPANGDDFASLTMKYASQHLAKNPIEIGGQNCGPWVRTYMDGNEGKDWPWCAGFVTFILKQVSAAMGCNPPISGSFDCWELARQAKENDIFVSGDELNSDTSWNRLKLCPCCIFLVRDGSGHWQHTGFACGDQCSETVSTIEGNTNDDGSAEGYEVCRRIRSIADKDFVRLA